MKKIREELSDLDVIVKGCYWGLEDNQGPHIIELDDGKIYRKTLYLVVKTMVSCRFSLKSIQ